MVSWVKPVRSLSRGEAHPTKSPTPPLEKGDLGGLFAPLNPSYFTVGSSAIPETRSGIQERLSIGDTRRLQTNYTAEGTS